jgi:hypothetical protein
MVTGGASEFPVAVQYAEDVDARDKPGHDVRKTWMAGTSPAMTE